MRLFDDYDDEEDVVAPRGMTMWQTKQLRLEYDLTGESVANIALRFGISTEAATIAIKGRIDG